MFWRVILRLYYNYIIPFAPKKYNYISVTVILLFRKKTQPAYPKIYRLCTRKDENNFRYMLMIKFTVPNEKQTGIT